MRALVSQLDSSEILSGLWSLLLYRRAHLRIEFRRELGNALVVQEIVRAPYVLLEVHVHNVLIGHVVSLLGAKWLWEALTI